MNKDFGISYACGSIIGISKNILGGQDSIMEIIHKGGLLGNLERQIAAGNKEGALAQIETIRQQMEAIKACASSAIKD